MNDDGDRISPSEASRDRRRDRLAEAESRARMRTGLAKLFKQVLDAQSRRAKQGDAASRGDREARRDRPEAEERRRPT